MSFEESIRKNLVWADITTLKMVMDLANAYRVADTNPEFIAALVRLKEMFAKDLIDVTESK